VRDASGNVMAVYSLTGNNINTSTLNLSETHLYGSSRLGIFNRTVNMDVAPAGTGTANLLGITTSDNFARGNKFFELSNHLGNVLVTVSDRKFGQNPVNNLYTSFTADVVSATDYAPFGMQMVGRTFSAGSYRYGFGGQERSTELNNDSYTAEFWQYDARLGRRWNVDPKPKTYESAYMAFGGNPINVIDPNGADSVKVNGKWSGVWKSEKGNTLDGLAKAFGTSTKTIERLNPNTDFNNLSEGTNIRVQGETTIFGASDGALAVQQKGALEVTPLLNYKMNFLYNQLQQDGYINFMIESLGVTANISIANNSISAINIGIDGTQNQNVVIDNVNQLLNAFGLKVDMSLGIRIQPGIMNQASKDFNLTKTVVNGNYKRGYGWFGQIKPTVISEMQKASKGVSLQIQTYTNIMIESIRIMMASGNMHDWSGDDPDQITLKGDRFFSPGTNIYHKYLGVTIQKQ
jgi:RHS repeat-associated protein